MEAMEAIRKRRSVRSFSRKEVPREIVAKIVDAGRLAATAMNLQPWEFVVVTNREGRADIAKLTDYGKFIAEAPACVAVFCRERKYYLEDGSAATENMLLAATALGLGTCWVAGDKKRYAEEVGRRLGVPEGLKLVSLVAVGFPKGAAGTPRKRALEDVLHWGKF